MRRYKVVFFTIFSLIIISKFAQADLNDGLVAYYPFNGNANDESANENHGVVNGATLTTDRFGNPDSAYNFYGINEYIDCGNDATFNITGEITVSAWLKARSFQNAGLVTKWKTRSGWSGSWGLSIDATGFPSFMVSADGWNGHSTKSNVSIDLDTYNHVAGIYKVSDNTIRIYVNGIESGTAQGPGGLAVSSSDVLIGAYRYTITSGRIERYFDGAIDEVRIYNRTLSESEIQQLSEEQLSITTSISAIKLGDFFTQQLETFGGEPPFTWSINNGTVPPDMDLSPAGVFSGTPTEADEYTFTVKVVDNNGDYAEKEFTIQVLVTMPPPEIRIHKTGTVAVPGRVLDYFILVENIGQVISPDFVVREMLESWFTFIFSNPVPFDIKSSVDTFPADQSGDAYNAILEYDIRNLGPGDFRILSYQVNLDANFPLDQVVTGFATGFPSIKPGDEGFPLAPCDIVWDLCKAEIPDKCSNIEDPDDNKECRIFLEKECHEQWKACTSPPKFGPRPYFPHDQTARAPLDPNEKVVTATKFIQPNQLLVYPIHFENIGDVEALDVFITDVLDTNLDESTLEILTPEGASFDPETRTLKWELIGRNLQPGETGNVMLSIRPKPDLPSGTEIRNSAEIQFEIFEPLVTPEVVNIIDTTFPTCAMDQLPAETSTSEFEITWSGTDEIGEIDTYSIFVSTNDGTFKPYAEKTRETIATFTGEPGKTYGFICIATDTAGNSEIKEPFAEVSTLVNPPCEGDFNEDKDIDGGDLSAYIINSMGITLDDFALDFGRNICPYIPSRIRQ
jgi:uncharacterized repeat protein (TIGR01451 family)